MVSIIMKTLVLLLFSVMGLAQAQPGVQYDQTLVIIGDSLTEGYGVKQEDAYPHKLQLRINQDNLKWRVLNQGISGSTSASAPSRARWVLKKPPQIAILALGANDGLRGLKPQETEKNLEQAVILLKDAKVRVYIADMKMPPNYGGKYRKQFEQTFSKLARKHQLKLIPFFLEGVAGVPSLNLKDGIHPNALGHDKIADNIYKFLKADL